MSDELSLRDWLFITYYHAALDFALNPALKKMYARQLKVVHEYLKLQDYTSFTLGQLFTHLIELYTRIEVEGTDRDMNLLQLKLFKSEFEDTDIFDLFKPDAFADFIESDAFDAEL